VDYEHIPRYTDRSTEYIYSEGRYHPISPKVSNSEDGQVSKKKALAQMQDIAALWQQKEARDGFQVMRKDIAEVVNLTTTRKAPEILNALAVRFVNAPEEKHRFIESILRDVLESAKNTGLKPLATLSGLGLTGDKELRDILKISYLTEKYPSLKKAFKTPHSGVEFLVATKDVLALQTLIAGDFSEEINAAILKNLFYKPGTGELRRLQLAVLETATPNFFESFSSERSYSFLRGPFKETKDFLQIAIRRGRPESWKYLTQQVFDYDMSVEDKKELVKLLIDTKDPEVLTQVAFEALRGTDPRHLQSEIQLLIENGNHRVLEQIAIDVLSQPESLEMKEVVHLYLKNADLTAKMAFVLNAHSEYYKTNEYQRTLKFLMTSKDHNILRSLARGPFLNAKELRPLVISFIETAPYEVLQHSYHFFHDTSKEGAILRKAMTMYYLGERKKYMDSALLKVKLSPVQSEKATSAKAQAPSSKLAVGDLVEVKKQVLEVLGFAGEGRRGIVFKVKDVKGKIFALKVAKDEELETLASLQKESSKAKQWKQLSIPHAPVLVQGENFVLKPWIEGLRGDEVIERFLSGDTATKAAVQSIFSIIASIREQGASVGDFRPANMIWTSNGWVIIDSGSIQQGITIEEAHARWAEKFERRWKMEFQGFAPKLISCEKVFNAG
jgi:hypothetical protein